MAKNISLKIPAHYNIYSGKSNRNLRIEFSIPEGGCNENTGLAVLVPGFGGNIDSNVYKKMRDTFADKYNLITIQCDYFGSSFMQEANSYGFKDTKVLHEILNIDEMREIVKDPSKLMKIIALKSVNISMIEILNESVDEFNDMGFMQAIDILTSIEAVKVYLNENNLSFNKKRTIGYGHSHGAFLLHLCNRLSNVFSFIIDNSAWIEPAYLSTNRVLYSEYGNANLEIEFEYMAKEIIEDKRSLNLREIYKEFNNTTQIVAFQGNEDNLINHNEKADIITNINNTYFHLVTIADIDNIKFKSNNHGLDADFLEIFSYALQLEKPNNKNDHTKKYTLNLNTVCIEVDYTRNLPLFNFKFN